MNPSNEWNIATRGTAYAESENYTGQVFRDMVLDAFGLTEDEFQKEADKNLYMDETHLYEFTSPDNRVVTPYKKPEMVYLGSVDNDLGDFGFTAGLFGNCRETKRFYLGSAEAYIEAAKELDGLQEGFVVRDLVSGQAVKIKSPLYVAAHHLRGDYGLTPKKIARLVVTNETAEYLKYFPEDSEKIEKVDHHWEVINTFIEHVWMSVRGIETQKEFAKEVVMLPYSAVLFSARKMKENPIKVLNSQSEKYKMDLLLGWMEKTIEKANIPKISD